MLPNVNVIRAGGEPRRASAAVVIGKVIGVEKGFGFRPNSEDDADGGTRVSFDAPGTLWKSLHLVFRVERSLGPAISAGDELRVGLSTAGLAFSRMSVGMQSFDRLVLFLYQNSPVFSYDPDLYAVHHNGDMIATVDAAGQLALPFLEFELRERMLTPVRTLDALIHESELPERSIVYEP